MTDDSRDDIERLLQNAGARTTVPADRTARVRAVVHDAWVDAGRVRVRRRATFGIASVLGAAAVLIIALRVRPHDASAPASSRSATAGRVAAVVGTLSVNGSILHPGDTVAEGMSIRVGDDSVASVSLESSGEVRLDRGTAIAFTSRREMTLHSGAVYVDTGRDRPGLPVVVRTAFGEARDVGTRFEVRVLERGWRARVRDGAIRIDAAGATRTLAAGREVVMHPGGTANEHPVAPYDLGWNWTTRAAQPFRIEGATVRAFLRWAADESGRDIRFVDGETERALSSTMLHGSVDGLTAEEALDVVLPTCGLTRTLAEEQIVISRARARE
jgi:ferric-dicitrate binding protein FerR (iron transport regulator)